MRAELDVRDAARAPYLAPDRSPLRHQPHRDARRDAGAGGRPAPRRVRAWRRTPNSSTASPASPTASGRRRAREKGARRRVGRRARRDVAAPPADPPADAFFDARRLGRARDRRAAPARRGPRARLPPPRPASARSARSASRAPSRSTRTTTRRLAHSLDRARGPWSPCLLPCPASPPCRALRSRAAARPGQRTASHRAPPTGTRSRRAVHPRAPAPPPRCRRRSPTCRSRRRSCCAPTSGSSAVAPGRTAYGAQVTLRPAARPAGPLQHERARAQDDRRRRAAVAPMARPARAAWHGGAQLVVAYRDSPGLRRGPHALGRLRGRGPPGRPLARHRTARATASPASTGWTRPGAPSTASPTRRRSSIRTSRTIPAFPAALLLAARGRMTTFALVHGAWHGAWCWERLLEPLERRGSRRAGDRSALRRPRCRKRRVRGHRRRLHRAGRRRCDRRRALAQRADLAARRRTRPVTALVYLCARSSRSRARASTTSSPPRLCRC